VEDLSVGFIEMQKNTYRQNEIIILSKIDYDELEKNSHNTAFTAKLQNRIKSLDEGKCITKTMSELETIAI